MQECHCERFLRAAYMRRSLPACEEITAITIASPGKKRRARNDSFFPKKSARLWGYSELVKKYPSSTLKKPGKMEAQI
jgi:hypothetical protein